MATKRQAPLPEAWRKVKHPATRQTKPEPCESTQAQPWPHTVGKLRPAPSADAVGGPSASVPTTLHSTSSAPATLGSRLSAETPAPTRLQQAQSAQPKRGRQPRQKQQIAGQSSIRQFCQPGGCTGSGLASPLHRQQQLPGTQTRLVSPPALPRPLLMVPAPVAGLLGPLQPLTQQEPVSHATPAVRPALQLSEQQTAAAQANVHMPLAVVAGEACEAPSFKSACPTLPRHVLPCLMEGHAVDLSHSASGLRMSTCIAGE